LRRELLPGLLRRVERNLARGVRDVRLFEVGTAFHADPGAPRPREEARLAAVLTGRREPPHWSGPDRPLELWDLAGLLEAVAQRAHAGVRLEPGAAADSGLVPGEAWTVLDPGGAVVGQGGQVVPQRVDTPPWAGPVWGLELTLPAEPPPRPEPAYRPLPSHPGVDRDVALLVPDDVPAARVAEVARAAGGPLLAGVEVFDLFRGKGVPEGARSLAHRFRFRAPERTLTDDEVERATRTILDRLGEELGVHVRG
jgi:phenylalanyl-tRNA synthetase beta chain